MIKNLDLLIEKLEKIAPVFQIDIREDEVEKNPSLFIYDDNGEIRKSDNGVNSYLIKFYLYFLTKEGKEIDKISIIEMVKKHGLIFEETDIQYGKIESMDIEAKMVTFVFHQIEKVCL